MLSSVSEAWERERSVGCALCHPLIIRKRMARFQQSRVHPHVD